jgi:hypothetical protein
MAAAAICLLGQPSLARAATTAPAKVPSQAITTTPGVMIPGGVAPNATKLTSPTWAGWMDLANKGVKFQTVQGKFTVPKVTCTAANEVVSFWVGLDGATFRPHEKSTVEQIGVDAQCRATSSGVKPQYFDWYEMFPDKKVPVHSVFPNDAMTVSVSHNSVTGKYLMELEDNQHPMDRIRTKPLSCPHGSTCLDHEAEAIVEDPGGGVAAGVFLPKFGTMHFTEVGVITRSGTTGSLAGNHLWSANQITMKIANIVMATPSALNAQHDAFGVTWRDVG